MSGPISSAPQTSDNVRVRLPQQLKDQATAHARELGMTDAEYYRHCVRTMLGFYRDPAAIPVHVADPADLRRRAAFWDGAAQAELAHRYNVVAQNEQNLILKRNQLAVAATFALMAVEHGSADAVCTLGIIQLQLAELHRSDVAAGLISGDEDPDIFEMHGLANLDRAADMGDAAAADSLHGIAETLSPHVVTGAGRLSEAWKAEA